MSSFLSTLGELREASFLDKGAIVERLSQGGHPSVGRSSRRSWKIGSISATTIKRFSSSRSTEGDLPSS